MPTTHEIIIMRTFPDSISELTVKNWKVLFDAFDVRLQFQYFRCYDFRNIFAETFSEKIVIF
jgi:hypothetical protein